MNFLERFFRAADQVPGSGELLFMRSDLLNKASTFSFRGGSLRRELLFGGGQLPTERFSLACGLRADDGQFLLRRGQLPT